MMDGTLEERLTRLEDTEAVRRTYYELLQGIDARDRDALIDVFAEDASLEVVGSGDADGTYEDRAAILGDFFFAYFDQEASLDTLPACTGHQGSNVKVDLDGDSAKMLGYFFEILDGNQILAGTTQHVMRKEADRWRIAFLRITTTYTARVEATDATSPSPIAELAKLR